MTTTRIDAHMLNENHYLGARGARQRYVYADRHGQIVFASPASRRLPRDWLELSRWCLLDGNGSRQWSMCSEWIRQTVPTCTTIVSYSDPSVGHGGALYRACNWVWAPVWHVLREPPTGSGIRSGKIHRAKHRWVYLLLQDDRRERFLSVKDDSIMRRFPWASYVEPKWKRGKPNIEERAGAYKRWASVAKKP